MQKRKKKKRGGRLFMYFFVAVILTCVVIVAKQEYKIYQLKQENKLDEAFRILFIKQCNALNENLPEL